MKLFRALLFWAAALLTVILPIMAAASSPLLAWREPVYIMAGFAGIGGLGLLLLQPLFAAVALPGVSRPFALQLHRWTGTGILGLVLVHVAGLWVTSPPDVVDALLFASPTPFSFWGVVAMWAVLLSAFLAALRRRLHVRPIVWQRIHMMLAVAIIGGTIPHAVLIDGTMGVLSKVFLCACVCLATVWLLYVRRGSLLGVSRFRKTVEARDKG